ncbi:MAG: hypothetical protein KG003_04980 [Bacteroidetes bacterium]|nr:hypothetical protein [Bacteroidota bacterium]
MKQKLTITLAIALCAFTTTTQAQQAIGLSAGNHNAPYSVFQNPANTYSDRNRVYVNVWGAQIGFTNNFLTYNAPFGLIRMASGDYPTQYTASNSALAFDQNWLELNKANNGKLYYLNEVYGPSISFRTSRSTAIGFGIRGVSGFNIDGINSDAARMLRYGMDTLSLAFQGTDGLKTNTNYSNGKFGLHTEKYQEWYFSLAGVTKDKGPHFVKWGGSGKVLLGMGAAGLQGNGLDFSVNSNNQLTGKTTDLSFYHTNDESASSALSSPLGLKFDFVQGLGAGMDLGFVYEYRPDSKRKTVSDWWTCADEQRNGYDWKFGASVTDLGFIAYNGSRRQIQGTKTTVWNINTAAIDNYNYQGGYDRFQKVDTAFFDQSSVQAKPNDRFTTTTPVALKAQFDVNLSKNFYIGLNWQQNLKSASASGIKKSSYINLVPRWEGEHAELGIPITLNQDYTNLNVGLYGRLGPVIVGTDNLAGLAKFVGNDAYKSANVYFGVRFQIAACGWSRYHYYEVDSNTHDTIYKADTVNFWEKDTLVKKDTIIKEKIIRDTIRIEKHDTIIKYKNSEVPVDVSTDYDLRRKEADLKAREDALKKRELAVTERERQNTDMSTKDECAKRVAELEDQLKKERDIYVKLNTQYQDCKDERERMRLRISELERDLAKAKGDLKVTSDENASLKLEIDRLRAEITRLKSGNIPCGAQVKTLDSLLALEQSKNLELQKTNSKQKTEIGSLQKDNDDLKKRISDLETELAKCKSAATDKAAYEKTIKELQDQLAVEKAKSAGLQKELDDTKAKYQVALDKQKQLEEQLKNCGNSEELAKLKSDLEAQRKKCDELDLRVKTLESEKAALVTENSTLKAKVSSVQKDLDDTKAKLNDANQKILDLTEDLKKCGNTEELEKLKIQLDELNKSNSEKDATITALKADKAKLELDLSDAKAKITDLESQLKECKSKDCSELEAQLAEYKYKYETMSTKYDNLNAEYNALLEERNQLKSKLADCQEKLKNCSSSSEDISKLQAQITELKQTIGALQSELTNKQKSMDDLQEDYDKVVAEKATLEKQVTSLNSQVTSLKKQVADLEAKLKECQDSTSGGGGN